MKTINKNKALLGTCFFVIFVIATLSCGSHNKLVERKQFEAQLNDSISIDIYYNEENNTIRTIIISNNRSEEDRIYGFHDDGITPSVIGIEKNGVRNEVYYTYFSNGLLNNRINYRDGKLEGEYISYSEIGDIIYKAFYKDGQEISVETEDSNSIIEITEIDDSDK